MGLSVAGIGASGFLPYGEGRLWDKYAAGLRTVETAFPGAVLRTFRMSEMASVLETHAPISIDKEFLSSKSKYSDFLKKSFGDDITSISLDSSGGGIFGDIKDQSGKVIGRGLQISSGTPKGANIADYYARIAGIDIDIAGIDAATRTDSLNDSLLYARFKKEKPGIKFQEWKANLSPVERRNNIIIGARFNESFGEEVSLGGQKIKLSTTAQKLAAQAEVEARVLLNLGRAKAAADVGRLNILLKAPLEVPIIGNVIKKIPGIDSLAVKSGTATSMTARLVGKGVAIAAGFKGLEYVDYLRAEGNQVQASIATTIGGAALGGILSKKPGMPVNLMGVAIGAGIGMAVSLAPRFDDGVIPGAATIYADAQVARAEVSEATGVSESLRDHDRVAPGMSSIGMAAGFAGVGALTVGIGDYLSYIGTSIKKAHSAKGQMWETFDAERIAHKDRIHKAIWETGIGKRIEKTKVGSVLAKVKSPFWMGAIAGATLWAGLNATTAILSGNPVAAIPGAGIAGTTDTPEELEAIYSGEQEVAIRKGRWWEAGRGEAYEGGRIEYFRQHNIARLRNRSYQKGLYGTEEERWEYDPLLNPIDAIFGGDDFKYHYEQKNAYSRPAPLTGTFGEDVPFIGPLVAATLGKLIKPRKAVRPEEWNEGGGSFAEEPTVEPEEKVDYDLGGLGPGAPGMPDSGSKLFNDLLYRRREAIGLVGFAEESIQKSITGRNEMFQNQTTFGTMGKETGSEAWLWSHVNIGGGLMTTEAVRRFVPRTPSYLDTYNPLSNDMPSWMPSDYYANDFSHGNPYQKIKEAEIRLPGEGYAAAHPEVQGLNPEDYPLVHRAKILSDVAMYSEAYKETIEKAEGANLSEEDREMIDQIKEQVRQKKQRKEFDEYRLDEDAVNREQITITDVINPRTVMTEEYGSTPISIEGIGAVKDTNAAMTFMRETLQGRTVDFTSAAIEGQRYTDTGKLKGVISLGDTDVGRVMANKGLAEESEINSSLMQGRLSLGERLAGSIAETATHGIDTPLEYLTPFSPASKLIRERSAIEEYKATEAVGTGNAFWNRPLDHFLTPAMDVAQRSLGIDDIPEQIEQRRETQEYFDMLEWAKQDRIAKAARNAGLLGVAKEAQRKKEATTFGADIFGMPPMSAIPRKDRDYFSSFINAQSPEERQEIMNLIPENQQRIYAGQWMRQAENAARTNINAGRGTEQDEEVLDATAAMRKSEGFGWSEDLEQQWQSETGGDVAYDEWIRQKRAAKYFETHSLPGADWLGWHPSVDLEDVKMVKVASAGEDYHDYDLWDKREAALARKPYINTSLVNEMETSNSSYEDVSNTQMNASFLSKLFGGRDGRVTSTMVASRTGGSGYNVDVRDQRRGLIEGAYKEMGA